MNPEVIKIMSDMMERYPEHFKLSTLKPYTQTVGEFMERFLKESKGIVLAYRDVDGNLRESEEDTDGLLAEFFEIDRETFDTETEEMMTDMARMLNDPGQSDEAKLMLRTSLSQALDGDEEALDALLASHPFVPESDVAEEIQAELGDGDPDTDDVPDNLSAEMDAFLEELNREV